MDTDLRVYGTDRTYPTVQISPVEPLVPDFDVRVRDGEIVLYVGTNGPLRVTVVDAAGLGHGITLP